MANDEVELSKEESKAMKAISVEEFGEPEVMKLVELPGPSTTEISALP